MTDSGLSPQQLEVIDALSSGVNLSDAAAQAGVHRATIAYWRRNFPRFHAALAHAQYDRALMFRERAETLADLAFETLRAILTDPKASPSVRLKAAMFIIEKAVTPAPPKPDKPLTFNDLFTSAHQSPKTKQKKTPSPRTTSPKPPRPPHKNAHPSPAH